MRIRCRVVALAVGFGVFLLLYFLGGNGDSLRLKEVGEGRELEEDRESSWSPSSYLEREAKLVRKSAAEVGKETGAIRGKGIVRTRR